MTTPLAIFKQAWAELIPADVLPYIEAVNFQHDTSTAPDRWGAAIVQPEQRGDVTLGSEPWVEETGTILIGLFTRSGSGPGRARRGGRLHPPDVPRPAHQRAGDHRRSTGRTTSIPRASGEWWQLAMTARYTFQTRRDASGPLYGDWQGFPDAPPAPLPVP